MININRDDPRGIVWIASYPRSGNTWMRTFISCIVNVMARPDVGDVDINAIGKGSASEREIEHYAQFLGKPAGLATPAEIARARPKVQAWIARTSPRTVFVKTHNANALDHGSPLINKSASIGAIYIVRNPLDVAISYARFSSAPVDKAIETMETRGSGIPTDAKRVRVVTGSWSENVATWTDRRNPAVLVVRYEDMLASPRKTFGSITRHLRLKATDPQLRKAIELTAFDRLRAKEDEVGFVERPVSAEGGFFRAGQAGQWRDVLTKEQVGRIVSAHAAMMRRFGYVPKDHGLATK